MAEDEKAKFVIRRMGEMRSNRSLWEPRWQDIRDLVRPNTHDFTRMTQSGLIRTEKIYDGTAMQACEELAAGLHSFVTNPSEMWFSLLIENMRDIENDPTSKLWLERVADIMFQQYSDTRSNFTPSMEETYQDLCAFGTNILYQDWDIQERHLTFQSFPLADCYIAENSKGRVDTCYRQTMWDTRKVQQHFPEESWPKEIIECKNPDKEWTVIHAVHPRTDRVAHKIDSKNMPFASLWVIKECLATVGEGGFRSFPYHVARWSKLAKEQYGRSPAHICLPDIKMLNAMERTLIKVAEKIADPPIQVPNDGFILPIRTSPGALMFREPGTEKAEPLVIGANLPLSEQKAEQKRNQIMKAFHADWLKLEKENVEMTAYEVQDRRDEKLRQFAPKLGRVQAELLEPIIVRSYELLQQWGRIPSAPMGLQRRALKVGYVSPAAKAQSGSRAVAVNRFIQDLAPAAQIDPQVYDCVDFDKVAEELADARGVSQKVLRSPEAMVALRKQKADQQQMQQMSQVAEPVSKSIKNLADASKSNPGISAALQGANG